MLLSVPVPAHLFPQPGEQFSFLSVEDGTQIISVTGWHSQTREEKLSFQAPIYLVPQKLAVIDRLFSLSLTHTWIHTHTSFLESYDLVWRK